MPGTHGTLCRRRGRFVICHDSIEQEGSSLVVVARTPAGLGGNQAVAHETWIDRTQRVAGGVSDDGIDDAVGHHLHTDASGAAGQITNWFWKLVIASPSSPRRTNLP